MAVSDSSADKSQGGVSILDFGTVMRARQITRIASVVSLYWFVSISMVFINKYLLSDQELKLDAPIFITLSQCIVAILSFAALGFFSISYPNIITFPHPEFSPSVAVKVAPLSLVFVGMITLNNLTLKHLGVAFYNVGRSLTTVFNVTLSFMILKQKISPAILSCCAIVMCGFLFGIKEEDKSVPDLSFLGVLFGVMASLFVALYAIFIKRILPLVDHNVWRLQIYNNGNACALLLPVLLLNGELSVLSHFQFWTSLWFWFVLLVAGVFGIAIGYVTSLQIKVTSPLTHNISGTAKACAQTILACLVFSEAKSWWWWMCNFMVLGGSSAYTYVRMFEMKSQEESRESERPALVTTEEEESEAGS